MNKKPGIIADNRFFNHQVDRPSPENPNRLRSLYQTLSSSVYVEKLTRYSPREASDKEVYAVHSEFYVDQIREQSLYDNPYSYDLDTYLMDQTLHTAILGAGGCLELADRIMNGDIDYGFSLNRPPGHHAEAGRGMGFCVLNNAAITAQYLRSVYGLNRILVFDFDIHHCNGTQEIFYDTDEVLVLSLHQENLFPFTGKAEELGEGEGKGYTVNIPVFPQFGDPEYSYLCGKLLSAIVEQYMPQIILVSAGYDGHVDDSISKTVLATEWYGKITEMLKCFARECCDNRLLFVLEGGYNPKALEDSVLATLNSLHAAKISQPGIMMSERGGKILESHPANQFWTF